MYAEASGQESQEFDGAKRICQGLDIVRVGFWMTCIIFVNDDHHTDN